jgi:hypothetical protein
MNENDWGLPDWTRTVGYPTVHAPVTVWSWEFLRRSTSYREFWRDKIQPFIDNDGRINRDAKGNWWPHHEELRVKFGVDMPSPPWERTPAHFTANQIVWISSDGQRFSLKKNEIAIIIDLGRPLKRQFVGALKSAEVEQEYRQIAPKPTRAQVDQYATYLRILDALEIGETSRKIANLLSLL